jgi:hypothetical protein
MVDDSGHTNDRLGQELTPEEYEVWLEAVRLVQRRKITRSKSEAFERDEAIRATTKLHKHQKRILKWLWEETCRFEAYLEENDVRAVKYELLSSQERELHFRAQIFNDAGIYWQIDLFTDGRPTPSEKASYSRSMRRLVERGLVERRTLRAGGSLLRLTPLGRKVSNWLTPP